MYPITKASGIYFKDDAISDYKINYFLSNLKKKLEKQAFTIPLGKFHNKQLMNARINAIV